MSGLQVFISSSMRACANNVSWKVTFPVTSLCTSRDVSTHPRRAKEINEFSNLILHIPASFCTMIDGCVVFCEIVGVVVNYAFPKDVELQLCLSIPQPIVPHVPSFWALLMYIVVYETRCCGVICFQWRRWLWVVECMQIGVK